jgi:ABC-2 type transport system ATP-binding protein
MCTHAAIMSAGSIVAQGSLDELRGAGESHVRVRTADASVAARVLARFGLTPILSTDVASHAEVTALLPQTKELDPDVLLPALLEAGVRVRGYGIEEASLEERFVALTGEGFDVRS